MSVSSKNPILVSAIVPARNEEAVIGACVESLAQQPEIGEIVVANDQSTDNTAAIVTKLTESLPKLRLLETRELPVGWVGKNHAVWLGALQARGEWLLFTDADAVHKSDSAARALAIAAKENVQMVSFSPEQVMEAWYENALIPYVYCRLASNFSFDKVNDPAQSSAAANGQFLMIRRDIYEAVGGHASLASEVLEDVALAKRAKGAGHRIWFASGKGIVRVRMYRTFSAMWEGWKKNLYPLMGGSGASVGKEIVRAVASLMTSLIALLMIWRWTGSLAAGLAVLASAFLAITLAYGGELRRNQFSERLAWWGIPGRVLFVGVLWASYLSHRRGKLEWKGREYPVGTSGASK